MGQVVIGMDPHKRSATIEVIASDETILAGGRYDTDAAGYRAMLGAAKGWPDRRWAVEGCRGIGRHIASRLLADGEQVVDVPPKLSARARVFSTGQGRKTDATDAHRSLAPGTPGLARDHRSQLPAGTVRPSPDPAGIRKLPRPVPRTRCTDPRRI
jgi:transposase